MNPFFPECKHSWADETINDDKVIKETTDGQEAKNKIVKAKPVANLGKIIENVSFCKRQDDNKDQTQGNGLSSLGNCFNPFVSNTGVVVEGGEILRVNENEQNRHFKDLPKFRLSNDVKSSKESETDSKIHNSSEIKPNKDTKRFFLPIKEKLSSEIKTSFQTTSESPSEGRSSSFPTLNKILDSKKLQPKKPPPENDSEFFKKFKGSNKKDQPPELFTTPLQKNRTNLLKNDFRTPRTQNSDNKYSVNREALAETKKMLMKIQEDCEKEAFLATFADLDKLQGIIETYLESALEREEFTRSLLELYIEEIPELDPVIMNF